MKTIYQNEEKNTDNFLERFNELMNNFFIKEFQCTEIPIGIDNNYKYLLNGSHRTACSISFKEDLIIKEYENQKFICKMEYFKNRDKFKDQMPLPGNNLLNNLSQEF